MRSIIEELYYGNMSPSDRDIIRGSAYPHILNLVTCNEDELVQTLTQAQKEMFDKFKDCVSEPGDKNEMMSFMIGFELGMVASWTQMTAPYSRSLWNRLS